MPNDQSDSPRPEAITLMKLAESADSTRFDSNEGLDTKPGRSGWMVPASVENRKQPSSSQPCFVDSGVHVQADGKTVPSLADKSNAVKDFRSRIRENSDDL
jgi:hypothetical protein